MDEEISDFTDPTRYDAETKFSGAHDRHIFRTLHAHLPLKKIPENDLTDAFIQSLYVEVPRQGVLLKNIFVIGGPGCFVEGTLVTLADGTLKRIEEFGNHHLQNININVLRTDKKEPTDKAICFHKYENIPCYQIITETGKAIECSYNQPFWIEENLWIEADKLKIGDKIQVAENYKNTKTEYIKIRPENLYKKEKTRNEKNKEHILDEDLAAIFGYSFGDGNIHFRHKPKKPYEVDMVINEEEQDLIPKLMDICKNKLGIEPRTRIKKAKDTTYKGRKIKRKQDMTYLEIHSLEVGSLFYFLHKKKRQRIPPKEILQSPKSVVASFLRWYFEADGYVSNNGRGKNEIALRSSNPETNRIILSLLLQFNIQARIREKDTKLGIRRSEDMELFAEHIGFVSKKKKEKLDELVSNLPKKRHSKISFEKIKSIKKIGCKTVYDIETTKHDFIANGFKVHNTGKTTTQRSIGYEIANMYDKEMVQCLECNYLPDALSAVNPTKKVFVIGIDDPLREQDARRPSEKRALESTNTFLEIRHIVLKSILKNQAETFLGKKLDSQTEKFLEAYHDTPTILSKRFPTWVVEVGAVIFTIFGPQTPTIDQRLHMSKIWEIYKGFGSMDQQRRSDIKRELNKFWIEKLGQNEWRWRGLNQIEFMNKAIIKNTMTEEIGWLNLPKTDNVFEYVEAGAKRKQIEIKTETDLLDEWSQWIYENMNLLQPSYSPIEKKETRFMALRNLIRDIYKRNTDPRDFKELSPENQKFLEKGLSGSILIASLDDRIIKIHTLRSSDKEKINLIADRLLTELEKTEMAPSMKNATRIIRHICRKIFPDEEDFLDKKGIWKKIYDQLLYNWHQLYPSGKPLDNNEEDFESEEDLDEKTEESPEMNVIHRRIEEANGDTFEFNITPDEIIDILLRRYPDYRMAAEIYMHGNGICGRPRMTNREIYELSQMPEDREKYGFDEKMVSVDAVKYRRKQFTGLYSQELGYIFEDWIGEIVEQGYTIPGVLEDVVEVIHAKRGTTGYPDFIFIHRDASKTITSVKVYDSGRSESLVKSEFNPEIRALMNAKEKGEDARLLILFRNLGIPHMLTYRIYHNASDVPPIVTFPPSESNMTFFVKEESD